MVTIKLDLRLTVLLCSAALMGGFFLFSAFPSLADLLPSESSELAGWVQAIGAIASIAYAGKLVGRQLRHAEEQRQTQWAMEERRRWAVGLDEQLSLVRACVTAVAHAERALKNVYQKMSGNDTRKRDPKSGIDRLENLQEIILILLGKGIPSSAVAPLLDVSSEISYAIAALRALPHDYLAVAHDERAKSACKRLGVVSARRVMLDRLVADIELRLYDPQEE